MQLSMLVLLQRVHLIEAACLVNPSVSLDPVLHL
jgi:hypothetical protein